MWCYRVEEGAFEVMAFLEDMAGFGVLCCVDSLLLQGYSSASLPQGSS